eukprot:s3503_g10.t1
MFGKSSEKVAKQPVQPLSPAQQQALVSVEPAADSAAVAKLSLSKELAELQQQPGVSKYKARQTIAEKYGLSMTAVRNLEKTDTVAQLKQHVEQKKVGKQGLRRAGSHLALNKLPSKAQGNRIATKGKVLGRTDRFRVVWMTTAMWAQHEESQQHLLSLEDVVRDYEYRLLQAIEQGEKLEYLTATQQKELQAWRQKASTLQNII